MNRALKTQIRSFGIEIVIYGALVFGYLLLIRHFLGDKFQDLFHHDRKLYAALALVVIVAQGFLLEEATRGFMYFLAPRKKGRK